MKRTVKNDTGKPATKKRDDGIVTWLNPHIPASEGRLFVDTLTTNREQLGDYLTAMLSHCVGLTIKKSDSGDFTGYVFFDVNHGNSTKSYAVRSDAGTPEKTLLGLMFKFVVLLGCGDELRQTEEEDDFSDFA